ncbi:copper resistance CopC family protein [Aliikangiella sp. IMCC44632]
MTILKLSLLSIFISLFSLNAISHSSLIASTPAHGSSINSSPESLQLTFSKAVKLIKVELHSEQSGQVKLAFKLSPMFSETFAIPVPVLESDSYKVTWVAMGKDTHKMNGEFQFTLTDDSLVRDQKVVEKD